MRTSSLILLCGLALTPLLFPAHGRAQLNTRPEEQAFDYDPGAVKEAQVRPFRVETSFEDAVMINHPIYGTIVVSKYRWKNWVTRALYLTLINIALLAVILSLPKSEEYSLIISYVLSGLSATLSFWIFLCAVLILQLGSNSGLIILLVSAATAAAGYIVLMKVRRSDISLTELKESFQKLRAASHEDARLLSVEGTPGDWPESDFINF